MALVPHTSQGDDHHALPTRAEIRQLVAQYTRQWQAAVKRGQNHRQLDLDFNDQVEHYATRLHPDDADRFRLLVGEERVAALEHLTAQTEAETARLNAETERVLAENAQRESASQALVGAIIVALIFAVGYCVS